MEKLSLVGIGCGGRTRTYLSLAKQCMNDYFDVVAAADVLVDRAESMRQYSTVDDFKVFDSAEALFAEDRLADIAVIGTQDNYHVESCIEAMRKGYDVLLEKPISPSLKEVVELEKEARRLGRKVLVCHVLRYSPFYLKVKEIVDSGVLGEIRSLNATEGVGMWHFTHSYVRGHWSVKEKASPIIIAKSCHDMDIISWLVGENCVSASSYGTLSYFNKENAPFKAPERCMDGCPYGSQCPYNAKHYTLEHRHWLQYVFDKELEAVLGGGSAADEDVYEWLKVSPWGRCVFGGCDNNVPDHQTAQFEFEKGKTATFTVTAFDDGRSIEIFGTKGSLIGGSHAKRDSGDSDIIVQNHATGDITKHHINIKTGGYAGHGGGDYGLVNSLYQEMIKENSEDMSSSIHQSVQSHIMGFAAEESRVTGKVVAIDDFLKQVDQKLIVKE